MSRATLAEVAALGHKEKDAAREYVAADALTDLEAVAVRMAYLQGILWERKRWRHMVLVDPFVQLPP